MLGQILLTTKNFSCIKEKRLTWLSKEQISVTEEGMNVPEKFRYCEANEQISAEWRSGGETAIPSPWRTGGSLERMKKA